MASVRYNGGPIKMRTCPECKKQVPHRRLEVIGGVIVEAWRPMRHCCACGYITEIQEHDAGEQALHTRQACYKHPTEARLEKRRLEKAANAAEKSVQACPHCGCTPLRVRNNGRCGDCDELIHTTCPRSPGSPICSAVAPSGCPGAAICEGLGRTA